jgi:hypothetical protein
MGITRLYSYHNSYHIAELVRDGAWTIILSEYEPSALPVHLLTPQARISVPKVRAFIDFAGPKLKAALAKIAAQSGALAQLCRTSVDCRFCGDNSPEHRLHLNLTHRRRERRHGQKSGRVLGKDADYEQSTKGHHYHWCLPRH